MSEETFDPGFDILMGLDCLVEYYESDIRESFDWQEIRLDSLNNPDNDGQVCGITFLGTVFALSPSGKYYTPFACSNIDDIDAILDSAFYAALDNVAESFDGWIESGDGDPCDLFFATRLDD